MNETALLHRRGTGTMISTLRTAMAAAVLAAGLLYGVGTAAAAGPAQLGHTQIGVGRVATPTPRPTSGGFTVTGADLTFSTCEDHGVAWICPFTATFTFTRGTGGSVSWDILGTEVTCGGSSSAFDRPQPDFSVTSTSDAAWVSSALIFPEDAPPAWAASAHTSSAVVVVHRPNRVSSAPTSFYGPSYSDSARPF